jgi:co-chaperonin GroES (HSP10)
MNKFECLEDRCVIRTIKEKELKKTAAGIIDPGVKQKDVSKGEVVNVGWGYVARDTGKEIYTYLKEGDIVLYGTLAGTELELETENGLETLRIMREGDVILRISKKSDT